MSKVTGPLFSLGASKTLKDILTFQRRPSGHAVYLHTKPGDVIPFTPSASQITQRALIGTRVAEWKALSQSEKTNWDQLALAAGFIGTGYHYYIHKGAIPVPPVPDNAYSLQLNQASHQYASIADAIQTGLDLSTTFTIEAWVKLNASQPYESLGIVSKEDLASVSTRAYCVNIDNYWSPKLTLRAVITDGTKWDYYYYATPLGTGIWIHTAVTCDTTKPSATTFEFFINGNSVGHGTASIAENIASIQNTTAPCSIGARVNGGVGANFLNGLIDEVRIWNIVRTANEILNNYNKKTTGNESGLVANWRMENNYLDLTANNNDLTAYGNPVFSTDVPFS